MIRSTRPCVVAGIQRMSSGTSVPRPRTWRTIGPRFTVSGQTVPASTVGAAGLSRESPTLTRLTTRRPAVANAICRIRFLLALDGRAISMVGELDGKNADRDHRTDPQTGRQPNPIG